MWSDQTCRYREKALRHPHGRRSAIAARKVIQTRFTAVARSPSRSFALFTLAKLPCTGSRREATEPHTTIPRRRSSAGPRQTPTAAFGGNVKGVHPGEPCSVEPTAHGESSASTGAQHTRATCTEGVLQIATPGGEVRHLRLIRSIDRTGRWCLQQLAALWVIFPHDTEPSAHVQSQSVKDACVRGCQQRDAHANKPRLSSAPARGVVTPNSVRKVP